MSDLEQNKAVARRFFERREYFDTMHANDVLCSAPAPGFSSSAPPRHVGPAPGPLLGAE